MVIKTTKNRGKSDSFDCMASYLDSRVRDRGSVIAPSNIYPSVSISEREGAGMDEVAQKLLARLRAKSKSEGPMWTLFDLQSLAHSIASGDFPRLVNRSIRKDDRRYVYKTIDRLLTRQLSRKSSQFKFYQLMMNLCLVGHVIILGRTGNFLTKNISEVLQVRMVKGEEELLSNYTDAQRDTYSSSYSQFDDPKFPTRGFLSQEMNSSYLEDHNGYDLIINTEHLSSTAVAKLIESTLRAKLAY